MELGRARIRSVTALFADIDWYSCGDAGKRCFLPVSLGGGERDPERRASPALELGALRSDRGALRVPAPPRE